jgi:hypothetical protein
MRPRRSAYFRAATFDPANKKSPGEEYAGADFITNLPKLYSKL